MDKNKKANDKMWVKKTSDNNRTKENASETDVRVSGIPLVHSFKYRMAKQL